MHTGTDQAREPQTAYYRLPIKFHKWNSPSFPDCIGNCSLAISDATTIFLALLGSCSTTPTPFHRHFYLYIYGKCKNFHLFLFSFVCTHFCSFQIYETLIIQNNKKNINLHTIFSKIPQIFLDFLDSMNFRVSGNPKLHEKSQQNAVRHKQKPATIVARWEQKPLLTSCTTFTVADAAAKWQVGDQGWPEVSSLWQFGRTVLEDDDDACWLSAMNSSNAAAVSESIISSPAQYSVLRTT